MATGAPKYAIPKFHEDVMIDRSDIPEPDEENRQEAEELFLHRMVNSLVVAKVRQSRLSGLGDEAIRRSVLVFTLDQVSRLGGSGVDSEPRQETLVAWIEQALEDALADPWPDDFAEPQRRITDRVEGEPILLANGEAWTFPHLDLERFPRTLADGSIDLQYEWIQDPDGMDLLTALIWIDNDLSDSRAVLPHLLTASTLLLRRNYSLTEMECRQLMPIDPENPECVGQLIALGSDEIQTDASLASRPIGELTEGIVQSLLTLLAPVIEDIRKVSGEG